MVIDIPIGLPDAGVRQADVLARGFLGPRSASVFATPMRAPWAADDYKQTVRISQERAGGHAFAHQAFGLRTKIHEAWLPGAGMPRGDRVGGYRTAARTAG